MLDIPIVHTTWHHTMDKDIMSLKEKFNFLHSSLRTIIERCFGVWKMKWRVLVKMPSFPLPKQKMVVTATMTLHNFIRDHDAPDRDIFIGLIGIQIMCLPFPRDLGDMSFPRMCRIVPPRVKVMPL